MINTGPDISMISIPAHFILIFSITHNLPLLLRYLSRVLFISFLAIFIQMLLIIVSNRYELIMFDSFQVSIDLTFNLPIVFLIQFIELLLLSLSEIVICFIKLLFTLPHEICVHILLVTSDCTCELLLKLLWSSLKVLMKSVDGMHVLNLIFPLASSLLLFHVPHHDIMILKKLQVLLLERHLEPKSIQLTNSYRVKVPYLFTLNVL
jgi:hypothetical protein